MSVGIITPGNAQQGYADDSCWSRGQAWGIYGFMLSYLYTGDKTM
ncbi:glucuronyl hydrolase, partial [Enterobacter cloacae]